MSGIQGQEHEAKSQSPVALNLRNINLFLPSGAYFFEQLTHFCITSPQQNSLMQLPWCY